MRSKLLAIFLPLLSLPCTSANAFSEARSLSFYHTHTGKSLTVVYRVNGYYQPEALRSIDAFLADFRNDEIHHIDPALLDVLYDLKSRTGSRAPFEVISAYRSPTTNLWLRKTTSGVAEHSMHLEGRAIDVRLADVPLERLRDAALALERGGVGFYPKSDFVHVDTGRVRRW